MTLKQSLDQLLGALPEHQLREVFDFARFLQAQQEEAEWRQFGARQFARAYGANEPEYTEADLKPRTAP